MLRFKIWKRNKACCHLPKSASFQAIRVLNFIIDAKTHCKKIILNALGLTLAPFLPRHACARGLSSGPLLRGPTSVLAWVRPRVPSNLPPATGIADDRRPNPRGLSILISNLQLPFSLVWELSKEVACALISRCSDYRRLTICVAAAIVIIIPPHSHMIGTLWA